MKIVTKSFHEPVTVMERIREDGRLAYAMMPDTVYRQTDAVSVSDLKNMKESPSKYLWEKEHPMRPTEAMTIGTAIHMALLEPERFESHYTVMPKFDRRTKAGKAAFEDWNTLNKGKNPISQEDMDTVNKVMERATDNDFMMQFFSDGYKEASFFSKDEQTGLFKRCRTDNFVPSKGAIVDLKTTMCARRRVFEKSITDFLYFVQAAYYMDIVEEATGTAPDMFIIVAVEKTKDCDMNAFILSKQAIDEGRKCYRKWLNKLAECKRTNKWHGYADGISEYYVPEWKVNDLEI